MTHPEKSVSYVRACFEPTLNTFPLVAVAAKTRADAHEDHPRCEDSNASARVCYDGGRVGSQ